MRQLPARLKGKTSLGLVLSLVIFLAGARKAESAPPPSPLTDGDFYIQDLGHRCIDFGAETSWGVGGPVYIYSCNGTIAQQVRIKEIDSDTHDVQLMVQSKFCIGVHGGQVILRQPLELQTCKTNFSAQRFALDGDAILVGLQVAGDRVSRDYAIEPQNDSTNLKTPLVVSTRVVNDAEYFRFKPVSNPALKPTSGFVTADSEAGLEIGLALGWGTVIEVDPSAPIILRGTLPKIIHAGTTLRGYRKYLSQGPQIVACTTLKGVPAFQISEDNVRITGVRLHGPIGSSCKDTSPPEAQAILIQEYTAPQGPISAAVAKSESKKLAVSPGTNNMGSTQVNAPPYTCNQVPTYQNGQEIGGCQHLPTVFVDHVDISYFTGSAVDTRGADEVPVCTSSAGFPRDTPVRVIGNLIDHDGAFGSVVGQGAFILNQGNVEYELHAQAISSDPWANTGYLAYDNFMLSDERKTASFDLHGSGHAITGDWYDGIAGDYHDIGFNTSLRDNFEAIDIRGTPCRFIAIHNNVFVQSQGDAITSLSTDPNKTVLYGNTFNAPSPMAPMAVGDFDGDGVDDVFVGTGAGWYYSSGGQSEWRFLNRMTEQANTLLFADLDGDGRTDVIALHGSNIDVSWAGISPWETVNVTAWPLSNLAVGDFDGDGKADLFLATGTQWFYAPGGRNWTLMEPSVYTRPQLLFGDFQHTGRTEAIRAHDGRWLVAGLDKEWTDIGATPLSVDSVFGLRVADFVGDGYAELVRSNPNNGNWEFTIPIAGSNWTTLRASTEPIADFLIGRFDSNKTSDVLMWSNLDIVYLPSGKDPPQPLSRQEMR